MSVTGYCAARSHWSPGAPWAFRLVLVTALALAAWFFGCITASAFSTAEFDAELGRAEQAAFAASAMTDLQAEAQDTTTSGEQATSPTDEPTAANTTEPPAAAPLRDILQDAAVASGAADLGSRPTDGETTVIDESTESPDADSPGQGIAEQISAHQANADDAEQATSDDSAPEPAPLDAAATPPAVTPDQISTVDEVARADPVGASTDIVDHASPDPEQEPVAASEPTADDAHENAPKKHSEPAPLPHSPAPSTQCAGSNPAGSGGEPRNSGLAILPLRLDLALRANGFADTPDVLPLSSGAPPRPAASPG